MDTAHTRITAMDTAHTRITAMDTAHTKIAAMATVITITAMAMVGTSAITTTTTQGALSVRSSGATQSRPPPG